MESDFFVFKFKPFDKVLTKSGEHREWRPKFFSHYEWPHYITTDGSDNYSCIPYEGNEHLLGTTKDYQSKYQPKDGVSCMPKGACKHLFFRLATLRLLLL